MRAGGFSLVSSQIIGKRARFSENPLPALRISCEGFQFAPQALLLGLLVVKIQK